MTTTTTSRCDWQIWGCDASVVVTQPADADEASAIVRRILREVDDACSRFRPDSELTLRSDDFTHGATASPMLARLVAAALDAAIQTNGDVDPTLGHELVSLGYDRDISMLLDARGSSDLATPVIVSQRRSPWRDIRVDGNTVTIPRGVRLDLGASAKAVAADIAAEEVAAELGCGVLVVIGGDIATSGAQPAEGWDVLVQDTDSDPSQQVLLAAGASMATSSTQKRRWRSGGHVRHHILDPRSGMPAAVVWKSVTVAAATCLQANALSTASIVRGLGAVRWLQDQNVAARFVDVQGRVVMTDQWPAPAQTLEYLGGVR